MRDHETTKRSDLLSARRFLPLFLVQALGAFNDNVFKNAFVALITYKLASQLEMSVALLGVIAAGVFILPFALFAPVAGEIADRVDKAAMMRVVKLAEIILMIFAAAALFIESVFLLYVLLFMMGAQSAFFGPIKYGVLPQYVHESELVQANGYIQGGTFISILGGTILGTNLVLTSNGVMLTAIAIIAVAFVGYISSLFAPAAPADAKMRSTLHGMVDEAKEAVATRSLRSFAPFAMLFMLVVAGVVLFTPVEGAMAGTELTSILLAALLFIGLALLWPSMSESVRLARRTPEAWRAILAISWFWFVGATFMSQLPAYAKNRLGADETVLTVLLATFSIGVAIGSVISGLLFKGRIRIGFAPWGAVIIAVFAADLWFSTDGARTLSPDFLQNWHDFLNNSGGWRVLVDFIGLAVGAGIYVTPLNAVYQNAAPTDSRGRVVAASNMIDSSMMVASAVLVSVLLAVNVPVEGIYALIGGSGIIAAFLIARFSQDTKIGDFARRLWPLRDL